MFENKQESFLTFFYPFQFLFFVCHLYIFPTAREEHFFFFFRTNKWKFIFKRADIIYTHAFFSYFVHFTLLLRVMYKSLQKELYVKRSIFIEKFNIKDFVKFCKKDHMKSCDEKLHNHSCQTMRFLNTTISK